MSTSESLAPLIATDRSVARTTDRSFVVDLMGRARGWFQHKPSVELAQVLGCDVRTAERYFAGDRTPAAQQIVTLLRSEVGVRLIEDVVRDLTAGERQRFWTEMGNAAWRALIRERIDSVAD